MSRPGTEASKQAAAGVPHSAPAPVPVISTRRISPRAAVSSIHSRLRACYLSRALLRGVVIQFRSFALAGEEGDEEP
ncbi:unnamed protein product [Urochloa humidicola]